jgi:glycerol-3-phosphate dehydrogenase
VRVTGLEVDEEAAAYANEELADVVVADPLATALTDLFAPGCFDVVVLAVPSQTLRANLAGWRHLLPPGRTLVSLAKGVELGTLLRMSEVICEVAQVPADQVAVVSGPNLAREIAAEEPTATVIATSTMRGDGSPSHLRRAEDTRSAYPRPRAAWTRSRGSWCAMRRARV